MLYPVPLVFQAFCLHVVSSSSCIPAVCLEPVLFLIPLQRVNLFCNLSQVCPAVLLVYFISAAVMIYFYIWLAVHPNIMIFFFTNLMNKFFILICLLHSSTCFEQYCAHLQEDNCISTASGIVTVFRWVFGTEVTGGWLDNLTQTQWQYQMLY